MAHTLPPLGFEYDDLEPYIDSETMEIHHSKHHQAYVDKLNQALEGHEELGDKDVEELLKDLDSVPEEIRTAVKNHGGGHYNHSFFWTVLKLDTEPKGEILEALNRDFGSYDAFVEEFKKAAVTQFGSGWAWLVFNPENKNLEVMQTHDQESPISYGKVPIVVVDVWEHAYYLKYQNRRPDYVDAFVKVINWDRANEYYEEAVANAGSTGNEESFEENETSSGDSE